MSHSFGRVELLSGTELYRLPTARITERPRELNVIKSTRIPSSPWVGLTHNFLMARHNQALWLSTLTSGPTPANPFGDVPFFRVKCAHYHEKGTGLVLWPARHVLSRFHHFHWEWGTIEDSPSATIHSRRNCWSSRRNQATFHLFSTETLVITHEWATARREYVCFWKVQ